MNEQDAFELWLDSLESIKANDIEDLAKRSWIAACAYQRKKDAELLRAELIGFHLPEEWTTVTQNEVAGGLREQADAILKGDE